MKTRSVSRCSKRSSNLINEHDVFEANIKRFKRIQQSDFSESSDENDNFQNKTKNVQTRRLSSDSSDSSDSSEKVNSQFKPKKFKRIRLLSDSPVLSQETQNYNITNRRKRLLKQPSGSSEESEASKSESSPSDSPAESVDSDTDRSRSNDSSCSSEKSNVSARRTKRSRRIRFLANTTNPSEDESEQVDVTGLLKYKMKKLRFAVSYNNTRQVRDIIAENYVELNSPEFGSLLWRALENKNIQIMKMLMGAGVDVNVRGTGDDRQNTLLHVVAKKASNKEFEDLAFLLLEQGVDIEEVDGNGNSLLHCAISDGSLKLIKKLLELGANLDAINHRNESVLFMAAKSPLAEKLLPFLVQYNVPDLDTRDDRAMTALDILVRTNGDIAAIKALLDLKVPINRKNDRNLTLLDYAVVDRSSYETVKLLLDYGANPRTKRSDGNYYLSLACSIKNCSMAALLIKHGARIDDRNNNGQYPIHEACKYVSLQNIGLLLFLGADVNAVDKSGSTPFSLMSTYYLHDASKMMIKHFAILKSKKAHVNARDLSQICTHPSMQEYYNTCLVELENMKNLKIYNNITAHCVLVRDVFKLTPLIRNKDFVRNYYQNLMNITNLFPIYSSALQKWFKVALKIRKHTISLTDALDEATNFILPEEIWEIIISYACRERLVEFYV